jgi:hypothetical protein
MFQVSHPSIDQYSSRPNDPRPRWYQASISVARRRSAARGAARSSLDSASWRDPFMGRQRYSRRIVPKKVDVHLLGRPELALQPTRCLFGFQRIGAITIEALKRAPLFAANWQRQDQERRATGASRSFSLAHALILLPDREFVKNRGWYECPEGLNRPTRLTR